MPRLATLFGILALMSAGCAASSSDAPTDDAPLEADSNLSGATSITSAVVHLTDAADAKPWVSAPASLSSPTLARIILPSGKTAGGEFAVVPDGATKLELWVDKYDSKKKSDVAHLVGSGKRIGVADSTASYEESVPLALIERGTPAAELEQIPSLVRKKNDKKIYVRWLVDDGTASLYELSASGS